VFFVEPALSSKEHRQKMIELLFEAFGFSGLFMHKAPVLSTYLFAKESAMIVDVGAEYTHVVPVVEGYICSKAIMRADIGGETLTRELLRIASKKEFIRSRYDNRNRLTPSMDLWGRMEVAR
jgi:actin-related protein 2